MANSLGIDFNPQPAYGSDPFSPIVEGANLGFGLVQNVQKVKSDQEDRDIKRLGVAFEVFGKLPKTGKELLWKNTIAPLGSKALGQEFPSELPNKIDPYIAEGNQAFQLHLKMPDKFTSRDLRSTLLAISSKAAAEGETESFDILDKMIGNIGTDTTRSDNALSALEKQRGFQNQLDLERERRAKRNELVRNPVIRPALEMASKAKDIETLMSGSGPIGEQGAQLFIARMMQGGAQITDREGKLFSGSKSFRDRVEQAAKEIISGGLSERNKGFVLNLAKSIKNQANDRLSKSLDAYIENAPSSLFSKDDLRKIALSVTPTDMASQIGLSEESASAPVPITSQEEYDALPSGTIYVDSEGNPARKP